MAVINYEDIIRAEAARLVANGITFCSECHKQVFLDEAVVDSTYSNIITCKPCNDLWEQKEHVSW